MVGGGDSEGCERAGEWSFVVASAGLEVKCMASHKIHIMGAYIIDGWVFERDAWRQKLPLYRSRSLSSNKKESRDIIHSRFQELKQSKTTRKKRHPCFISLCLSAKDCFVSSEKGKSSVWVSSGKRVFSLRGRS